MQEPQPTFSACFGAPFLPQHPAVYAAHARREARRAPGRQRLAREHRLDGRAVRRGRADADRGDPRAPARRPRGRPRERRVSRRPDVRVRGTGAGARASSRASSTRARRGATRRRTTARRASSRGCSARTSSASRTPTRRSPSRARLRRVWRHSGCAAGPRCSPRGRHPRSARSRLRTLPASVSERPSDPDDERFANPSWRPEPFHSFPGGGSEARRPRRRRRLRRHARGDRGIRRRRGRRRLSKIHPDPQPLRRGRGRDQRRARKRVRGRPREARLRHGQGLRLPGRPGRDRGPLRGGAGRRLPARALGRGLLAHGGRADRAAPVRRRRRAAHGLRGRHHRPRPRPRPLRADDEARRHDLRGVVRLEARRGRRALPGRDLLGHPERRPQARRREDGHPLHRRRGTALHGHDERLLLHRRRDGDGAARWACR